MQLIRGLGLAAVAKWSYRKYAIVYTPNGAPPRQL